MVTEAARRAKVFDKIIRVFGDDNGRGGLTRWAKGLGVSSAAVHKYRARGIPVDPENRVIQTEKLTEAVGKRISRAEMRPDIYDRE